VPSTTSVQGLVSILELGSCKVLGLVENLPRGTPDGIGVIVENTVRFDIFSYF
jgi:hypothetical protein